MLAPADSYTTKPSPRRRAMRISRRTRYNDLARRAPHRRGRCYLRCLPRCLFPLLGQFHFEFRLLREFLCNASTRTTGIVEVLFLDRVKNGTEFGYIIMVSQ